MAHVFHQKKKFRADERSKGRTQAVTLPDACERDRFIAIYGTRAAEDRFSVMDCLLESLNKNTRNPLRQTIAHENKDRNRVGDAIVTAFGIIHIHSSSVLLLEE